MDKERFFEVIDWERKLNAQSREAYWKFYQEECQQDIVRLYKEGDGLLQDPALHQSVKASIDKTLNLNIKEESDKINPIITPAQKQSATTWGTNDDVKGK